MLVLAGHAEQVALVIMRQAAIRSRPEQAVAVAAVGRLDDQAAGHHRVDTPGLLAHPDAGRAVFRLGQGRRFHAEAGAEHLRQHHQVDAAGLFQQGCEVRAIGRRILPGQFALDQRQFEVGQSG
ncbi:hypothetical protein D3C80_1459250 [compost metagenome]